MILKLSQKLLAYTISIIICVDIFLNGKMVQEEEILKLFSGSENSSIINIKLTTSMHTAWIFKEQAKVKEPGLREKGLVQSHYSIQHIEGYDLLC
jgi:hypothetical protein